MPMGLRRKVLIWMIYRKRRLSPCRKKLLGADDDEGCQTGVVRNRSGAEVGQEHVRSKARAGQKQGKSRAE